MSEHREFFQFFSSHVYSFFLNSFFVLYLMWLLMSLLHCTKQKKHWLKAPNSTKKYEVSWFCLRFYCAFVSHNKTRNQSQNKVKAQKSDSCFGNFSLEISLIFPISLRMQSRQIFFSLFGLKMASRNTCPRHSSSFDGLNKRVVLIKVIGTLAPATKR